MTDCARGCLLYGLHTPDCGCTNECPDHNHHCEGCLPRQAEIGHYCQRHAFQLRDTINALPALITGMYLMPGGQLAPRDRPNRGDDLTRRATKVDQTSPSPALNAADEAAWWLHRWAVALADSIGERGPFEYRNDGVPHPNATVEARYLTSRLSQLCAQPYANDLNDEARQFTHALTRTTGTDSADQRIPVECPHCGRRTLTRPNGTAKVVCRNKKCTVRWSSDEYDQLAREATA